MKKTGFKTVAVVALVLTVLLGLVLAGPGRHGRRPRGGPRSFDDRAGGFGPGSRQFEGHGERGMLRMLGRLDLTDGQKESIKQITEASKEKNKTAAEAVGEARKALHEAVAKGDETAIRNAATNLGNVLGDQAVLRAQTMSSIKAVLTLEQLKKLEELKATMKEQKGEFRGKRDTTRFHHRMRGDRRPGDSWGPHGGRHGFRPYGRDPNAGAPTGP